MSTSLGIQAGITAGSSLSGGSNSFDSDYVGTLDEYGDEIFGGYSTRRLKGVFPKLLPADYSGARAAYSLRKVRSGYPKSLPAEYGDGAAAAYSLRRVNAAYKGFAIKVRRSSDDAVQDIGFSDIGGLDTTALTTFVNEDVDVYTSDFTSGTDGWNNDDTISTGGVTILGVENALEVELTNGSQVHQISKSSVYENGQEHQVELEYYIPSGSQIGQLQVTGLSGATQTNNNVTGSWQTMTVTGGTAVTTAIQLRIQTASGGNIIDDNGAKVYFKNIVVTQTTADGHVTTWYDQSGNGKNATNSTESEQPLIVDGGTLVEENGKAAIQFDGVDDYLAKIATLTINGDHMISAVHTPQGVGGYLFSLGYNDPQSVMLFTEISNFSRYWLNAAGDRLDSGENVAGQRLTTGEMSSGSQTLYIDGSQNSTKSTTYNGGDVPDITIGYAVQRAQGSNYLIGKVQELIFFNSDQSDNRPFIEENINTYYDIYAQDEWDKESAIKVRRSSDDAVQNIGFVGNELGTEALTNFVNAEHTIADEDFSSSTGWTLNTGVSIADGVMSFSNSSSSSAAYKDFGIPDAVGTKIRVSFTIRNYSGSGYVRFIKHAGAQFVETGNQGGTPRNANGTYTEELTFTGTTSGNHNWGLWTNLSFTGDIDNFEVVQITADGHVTTWYDQSGFGNHATQGIASRQPKIVDAGNVVTENGKPAIDFDGTDDNFIFSDTGTMANGCSSFTVFAADDAAQDSVAFYKVVDTNNTLSVGLRLNIVGARFRLGGAETNKGGTSSTDQVLLSQTSTTSPFMTAQLDGVEVTSAANIRLSGVGSSIGSRRGVDYHFDGTMQEIVFFESNQSTNRRDIEWNINNHYSTYEQWNRNSALSVRRSSDDTTKQIGFDGSSDMSESEVLSFVNDASPVLDDYTGDDAAAAAYSLRKVRTAYEGSAIKVRRSSDDGLQDIGFDSNGDLDTTALLAFVNEDVNQYTSDFSSTEDLVETNGTGAAAQSVGGVDDAYKFTLSGGSALHQAIKTTSSSGGDFSEEVGTLTFDYYLPSGQTMDDVFIGFVSGTAQGQTTTDAWTSVSMSITAFGSGALFFRGRSGGSQTFAADGDVFYLKNIVVTQTTADGHVTTWYDQAGSNNASNSSGSEQPLIVEAGDVVLENGKPAIKFDGVDDMLQKDISPDIAQPITLFHVRRYRSNGLFGAIGYDTTAGTGYGDINVANDFRSYYGSYLGTTTQNTNQGLWYSLANGTSSEVGLDGATAETGDAGTAGLELLSIGSIVGSFDAPINTQEIIIFDSDQSGNRQSIEGNIGRYYNLDGYRDGFVTKWYDQSNNDNHLENASASQQPKIVEDGVMITENGHPAIEFNRTTEEDILSVAASFTQPVTHFFVRRLPVLGGSTQVPLSYSSGSSTPWGEVYLLSQGQFRTNFGSYIGTFASVEDLLLQYVLANETGSTIAYNGADGDTGNAGSGNVSGLHVGRNSGSGSFEAHVKAQELIVYQKDISESRREIEQIINRHFRIYL